MKPQTGIEMAQAENRSRLSRSGATAWSLAMRTDGGTVRAIVGAAMRHRHQGTAGRRPGRSVGAHGLSVFLGGGPRLFEDGLMAGRWTLASQPVGEHGALSLVYDRVR